MKIKNSEYLKYIAIQLESEFGRVLSKNKYSPVFGILKIIKNSNNLFRDIFILSRNKNLEIITSYLLFIIKKLEEGEITFENLAENLEADSDFLKTEFVNSFEPRFYEKHNQYTPPSLIEPEESEIKEWKPLSIPNETLEEEFLNSEIEDIFYSEKEYTSSNGLSLIKKEESLSEKAKVFSLPSNESNSETEKKSEENESEGKEENGKEENGKPIQDKKEVFELPGEQPDIAKIPEEEISTLSESEEHIEEVTFTDETPAKEEHKSGDEIFEKEINKKPEEDSKGNKSLFNIFKKQKGKTGKAKEEIITTINKEPKKILISPDAEIKNEELSPEKEITQEPEKTKKDLEKELINRAFEEYQIKLKSKNILITKGLGELYDFCAIVAKNAEGEDFLVSDVQIGEREKNVIEKIVDDCSYMENYSRKMSFEIITTVYNTMYLSLNKILEAGYGIDQETVNLFLNAIILIQRLIEGGEYSGFQNTLILIEEKRNNLVSKQKEKEEIQNLKKEKQELEKKLLEKYSDSEQRNDIKELKNHILNLEKHFTVVKSIEGNFRIYESLRALSPSFINFKKIVEISLRLKKDDLAKLAEASYVFIKHIQNYRINPQSQHILEILDDIINSMKLLFLEKQLDDIQLFIKFLNNPENLSRELGK